MKENNINTIEQQNEAIKKRMMKVRNIFIVMSGKGGVGKTSVAVNLAWALSLDGKKVGILDTDLHGPNIAKMLGIEDKALLGSESGMLPVDVSQNLKAVSMALTGTAADQPFIWRGPMKAGIIRQLLADVNWGDLDFLIIDSPPGTGDEPLSVCQLLPNLTGAVIVTTPQDVAILDARKSILFARQLRIPVAGLIENMSGFVCPKCGEETNLFKKGGGEKAAAEMGIPFLGRVPFEPELVEMADSGTPFVSFSKKSRSAEAFMEIVRKLEGFGGAPSK